MIPFIIVFVFVLTIASIVILYRDEKDIIPGVIAGNVDQDMEEVDASVEFRRRDIPIYKNGLYNKKRHFAGVLLGDSMIARGLKKDDIVLGKRIKNPEAESLNKGDLVIIEFTNDKNINKLKIREFEEVKDDEIITCKYENGERKLSHAHKLDKLQAIIDRKI